MIHKTNENMPDCISRSAQSLELLPAANEQQEEQQGHDAEGEGYQRTLSEACHEEREERHGGGSQGVGQLGGDAP